MENLIRNLKNCKTAAEFQKDIELNLPVAINYFKSVSKEDQVLKQGSGTDSSHQKELYELNKQLFEKDMLVHEL